MTGRVYLDWNATAPLRPAAREAMRTALDLCGNPSSVHGEGRAARRVIEEARGEVAALVGADPRNVIFTSGGTEANALALSPVNGQRLLVSAIEHPSVLAGGRFSPQDIEQVPVDMDGIVDLAALEQRLEAVTRDGLRPLVSLMAANNESGVIQPVAAASEIVHRAGGLLHVDAVQAAGRIALDMETLGADLMTLSAHKLGGAKGAGALIRRDESIKIDPLIRGGGQERGSRAGTENAAAVAAFAAAAAAVRAGFDAEVPHMAALRDRLEAGLRNLTPEAIIYGANVARLPNTTLVAMPGAKAETFVIAFDLDALAVSSGAACSSGKVAPSHVLAAMGVAPALARGAIRVSLGPTTTEAEIDRFLQVWQKLAQSLSIREKRGQASRKFAA
jgi:cysteine desulfurase